MAPRTPTRSSSRAHSQNVTHSQNPKTPLTPSLYKGLSNVSLGSSNAHNISMSSNNSSFLGGGGGHVKSKSQGAPWETSNPFIVPPALRSHKSSTGSNGSRGSKPHSRSGSKSRNASPIKRTLSSSTPLSEEFVKQAQSGVLRKGGVESRMDVVQMDYVMPVKSDENATVVKPGVRPRLEQIGAMKRSRSTPGSNRDRFITTPTESTKGALDQMALAGYEIAKQSTVPSYMRSNSSNSAPSAPGTPGRSGRSLSVSGTDAERLSPSHTQRLIEATGLPIGKRILGYHVPPPNSRGSGPLKDNALGLQREYVKPLFARSTSALPSNTGSFSSSTSKRKIPTIPERVLDAPGLVDDFYLNLLSWSATGVLAVALESSVFLWNSDTGSVSPLLTLNSTSTNSNYVSSLSFSSDGAYLGVGTGEGGVELWDVERCVKLRNMSGRQGQVATLSWNNHVLTSGCGDGSIWNHDVRAARHHVQSLIAHTGEVCGLTWRAQGEGELLASGGNDNVVCVWDGRVPEEPITSVGEDNTNRNPKWTKRNHTAAVKALAWNPWNSSLLASGGGTNDATINVWNVNTGARVKSTKTPSQITSLIWSPTKKEILSTHGYPTNAVMVHGYPSLERITEIRDAHDTRVLYTALSPDGDVVCTGAGDEAVKFWRVWDSVASTKRMEARKEEGGMSSRVEKVTRGGVLSIR